MVGPARRTAAAGAGLAAEVSSAGWRKTCQEQYPAVGLLERFAVRGVGFTTASDAHGSSRVAERAADLRRILAGAGVEELVGFRARARRAVTLADPVGEGSRP